VIEASEMLINDYSLLEMDEGLELLETIHFSAKGLYRLTQNVLLHAELELIATDPDRAADLRQTKARSYTQSELTDVAHHIAHAANRMDDLQMDLQDAVVPISDLKLRKIAEEIINNAFKFSKPGTPVRVVSSLSKGVFKLYVIDHGHGMTHQQVANIGAYVKFEHQPYEHTGTGLGLTIAKRLVELHDGTFAIESIPGKQTIVQVSLKC
jgi:two-component system sensor histidine kinase/response regulator